MKDNQMKQAEREEFENEFSSSKYGYVNFKINPFGDYENEHTRALKKGWDVALFSLNQTEPEAYFSKNNHGEYSQIADIRFYKGESFPMYLSPQAKLTTSQVSKPYIYEVVDADDTYYTKEKPTYKGFYFVKPLYLHPPTTPQESISHAIEEYIAELESMMESIHASGDVGDNLHSVIDLIASKPTGLE